MGNPAGGKIEPREERLVSEFVAATYPRGGFQTRVRLGPLKSLLPHQTISNPDLTFLGNLRRWIDAIVTLPEKTVIIEGAIYPDPGDISRLLYYETLFLRTPEFEDRWTLPVQKTLVLAIRDTILETMARGVGIEVRIFTPPWIKDYLATLELRKTRPVPPERQ